MFAIIIFEVRIWSCLSPIQTFMALSSIKGKELSMPYKPDVMAFLSLWPCFLAGLPLLFLLRHCLLLEMLPLMSDPPNTGQN